MNAFGKGVATRAVGQKSRESRPTDIRTSVLDDYPSGRKLIPALKGYISGSNGSLLRWETQMRG